MPDVDSEQRTVLEECINAAAASDNETFPCGTGSPENPYRILNAFQLSQVRNYLNKSFRLIASIDTISMLPIGSSTNPFKATFSAQDLAGRVHKISNLTITGGGDDRGLFGYTDKATLDNLNVSYAAGFMLSGVDNVGGLVGNMNRGSIENSYATGNVKGKKSVGGLVGQAGDNNDNTTNNSSIINSYAMGDVTGETNLGGLVGDMSSTSDNSISNSYAMVSVTGTKACGQPTAFGVWWGDYRLMLV